jgi:hypothetical protein
VSTATVGGQALNAIVAVQEDSAVALAELRARVAQACDRLRCDDDNLAADVLAILEGK